MTNHEIENIDNIITLIDETGNEIEFEIIDMIEVDEEEYAILIPKTEENEEEEEAIILKIGVDENGEEMLFEIESDDEWDMVASIWKEMLESEETEDELQ